MARTVIPPDQEPTADDYIIEREDQIPSPPISAQIIRALRVILLVILAAASLALFWLIGTMIGLF